MNDSEKRRAPYTLSALEIVFASLAALITVALVRFYLWKVELCCRITRESPIVYPPWFLQQRDQLFFDSVLPIAVIMMFAAISLVRAIRNDVRGFSRLGQVMLASPLISLPIIGFFSPFTDMVGILLAIAMLVQMVVRRQNKWNLIAPVFVIVWLVIDAQFTNRVWGLAFAPGTSW